MLTSGSSTPHPLADVLVLAADASDIDSDNMSANYGSPSTHPSTPSSGVSAHTNSTPTGLPPGHLQHKEHPHRNAHAAPLHSRTCAPHALASSCIIHNHTPQPWNLPPGFFFTLLATWAVCEVPSSHCTLCRHVDTHNMSLQLSTLLLNMPCVHRVSTPGAHG